MMQKFVRSAPLEILFPMELFFVEVKISSFWPEIMDYSQVFRPKLMYLPKLK